MVARIVERPIPTNATRAVASGSRWPSRWGRASTPDVALEVACLGEFDTHRRWLPSRRKTVRVRACQQSQRRDPLDARSAPRSLRTPATSTRYARFDRNCRRAPRPPWRRHEQHRSCVGRSPELVRQRRPGGRGLPTAGAVLAIAALRAPRCVTNRTRRSRSAATHLHPPGRGVSVRPARSRSRN